jgi:hypothetical protein
MYAGAVILTEPVDYFWIAKQDFFLDLKKVIHSQYHYSTVLCV